MADASALFAEYTALSGTFAESIRTIKSMRNQSQVEQSLKLVTILARMKPILVDYRKALEHLNVTTKMVHESNTSDNIAAQSHALKLVNSFNYIINNINQIAANKSDATHRIDAMSQAINQSTTIIELADALTHTNIGTTGRRTKAALRESDETAEATEATEATAANEAD